MRFLGVEQVLILDGQRYRLGRFTLGLLRRWLDWAIEQLDPLPIESLPELSPQAVEFFEETAETWRTLDNPHVRDLYHSDAGQEQAWCLLFDRYHWALDPRPLAAFCPDLGHALERAGGQVIPTELEIQHSYLCSIGKAEDLGEGEPTDWEDQFRNLFANIYLPPHEVAEMTMAELTSVCRGKLSQDMMAGLAQQYAKLTPEQRKAMAILRIRSLLR